MAIPDRLNELSAAVDGLIAENIDLKATIRHLEKRIKVLENPNADSLMTEFLRQN